MGSTVSTSGPLFDGRAEEYLHDAGIEVRHAVAHRGVEIVRETFEGSIRANHGRFLSSVTTTDESHTYSSAPNGRKTYTKEIAVPAQATAVTTSQAAYGPWLEGSGSRNTISLFKGYHGFDRSARELDTIAGEVADRTVAPYVEKMNS